jgi:hypothetical protein
MGTIEMAGVKTLSLPLLESLTPRVILSWTMRPPLIPATLPSNVLAASGLITPAF